MTSTELFWEGGGVTCQNLQRGRGVHVSSHWWAQRRFRAGRGLHDCGPMAEIRVLRRVDTRAGQVLGRLRLNDTRLVTCTHHMAHPGSLGFSWKRSTRRGQNRQESVASASEPSTHFSATPHDVTSNSHDIILAQRSSVAAMRLGYRSRSPTSRCHRNLRCWHTGINENLTMNGA